MAQKTFDDIVALLDAGGARYSVMEHAPEGRCAEVSALRGNRIQEANKALVVRAKPHKKSEQRHYFLLALRADQSADLSAVGYADVRLCDPDRVRELTGCEPGTVPPFSFDPRLKILADPLLLENESFWFNAGLLDRSIRLSSADYVRLVAPEIRPIGKR